MHTARDIIQMALKKIGVLRAGGQASAADAEDARLSLQSLYAEWITAGAFGRVWDVPVAKAGTITPHPNQHISIVTDDTVVVTPPATVAWDYWWTWVPSRDYGWGLNVPLGGEVDRRMPRDKSVIMVTWQAGAPNAAQRLTYVYDGTIQRWMRTDQIELINEAPLSARGSDGLASVLALRLLDLFGDSLASQVTIRSANSYKMALVSNYGNGEDYEYGRA